MVGSELMSLQSKILGGNENADEAAPKKQEMIEKESVHGRAGQSEDEEEEDDEGDRQSEEVDEEGDEEVTESEEGDEGDEGDERNEDSNESNDDNEDDKVGYGSQEDVIRVEEHYEQQDHTETQDDNKDEKQLRRSTRERKAAIGYSFMNVPLRKCGRKRTIDKKDSLFQLCTTRCSKSDGEDYFVSMFDYHLTRAELYCLRDGGWINDRLMSMIARTMVGEQKKTNGMVSRHIFSADFMSKIVTRPLDWSCEAHVKEFMPDHIGYNLGDAEFIFGPTIFIDHWFCYVLETKTMRFYALDSLVDNTTFLRLQMERASQEKGEKPKHDNRKKKKVLKDFEMKDRLARHCVWLLLFSIFSILLLS